MAPPDGLEQVLAKGSKQPARLAALWPMSAQAFAVHKADLTRLETGRELDITLRPAIAGQNE
jgi:hypothetical protein